VKRLTTALEVDASCKKWLAQLAPSIIISEKDTTEK